VLPNDFINDKAEKLLGKVWVELAGRREVPQMAHLLGFSAGVARGQPVLRLQFADRAGTTKPLRQHVNNRGIDIIDAVPQISKLGNGIGRIDHYIFSFCPASATEFSAARQELVSRDVLLSLRARRRDRVSAAAPHLG
jgi:hypothetical protein